MTRICAAALLIACSGSAPEPAPEPSPETTAEASSEERPEAAEATAAAEEVPSAETVAVGAETVAVAPIPDSPIDASTLRIRLQLERTTIRAHVSAANHEDARVTGRLYIFNGGATDQTLSFVTPATHELTWTLTREDGVVFVPTFLPPPMPMPDGPPRSQLTLQAGKELPFVNIGGISGFFRQGDTAETWAPLPPGRYDVQVSGVMLGDTAFTAPTVSLTAE